MICKRVLNNNVILAEDTSFQEYILIGRGLGLSSKPRIQVAMQQVEKRFVLDSEALSTKFQTFLAEIPGNHLALSNEIITMAETELSCTFSSETYIALADHITYVIKRSKQNKEIKNALLWEIKKLYPKEYQTGVKAVQMLRSYEKIKMGEDEAGFIALHFVNGQNLETSMEKTLKISNIISDIVAVIK
ncbi:MAG: PRD domain-containing protein, partial [Erysipelotrichaceae bacterium]